jgi:hypothetical protein
MHGGAGTGRRAARCRLENLDRPGVCLRHGPARDFDAA